MLSAFREENAYSWNAGAAEPMTLFIQKLFVTVSIRLINSKSIVLPTRRAEQEHKYAKK
jgi:hypothetical protein